MESLDLFSEPSYKMMPKRPQLMSGRVNRNQTLLQSHSYNKNYILCLFFIGEDKGGNNYVFLLSEMLVLYLMRT